jgi:hypothetical protein
VKGNGGVTVMFANGEDLKWEKSGEGDEEGMVAICYLLSYPNHLSYCWMGRGRRNVLGAETLEVTDT